MSHLRVGLGIGIGIRVRIRVRVRVRDRVRDRVRIGIMVRLSRFLLHTHRFAEGWMCHQEVEQYQQIQTGSYTQQARSKGLDQAMHGLTKSNQIFLRSLEWVRQFSYL
jgi:hypothetical protein